MTLQHIVYKNEFSLSYAEYGNKKGYPILVQHGMIASIKDYHLFDRIIESGARLISIARPGYGDSSPYCMSNLAEWGNIVSVLVDELKISQFDILGMSSGAPYSYAIGYTLPDKVRNIFIFSGIPALYDERVLALWPYPVNKQATITELKRLAKEIFFPDVSQVDMKRDDSEDSMMNDCFGLAQDLKLRCVDWGFNLSEVKARVFMQHSKEDNLAAAEITAHLLPNCILDIRESAEHFSDELLDAFIRKTIVKHNKCDPG